jgi:amino-acid N-acetyltransferase
MSEPEPVPAVVPLAESELASVARLLEIVGLDAGGLDRPEARLFGIRNGSELAGCVAYERGDGAVLLRSLAVRPDLRGRGLGTALVDFALRAARKGGAGEALLLTEGAEAYFAAKGWQRVPRTEVDLRFPESEQVRRICPVTAAAMRRAL